MNILTFDIEDWWIYDSNKIGKKRDWLSRLNNYLTQVLDLLDQRNIKATFFILGENAKLYPEILSLIASKGHHIGCHSFSHKFWNSATTPKDFIDDTHQALDTIENIIGKKVNAYRAPAFSITEKNSWILFVLTEHGIKYDCSIFPYSQSFGGFPSIKLKLPTIIEIKGATIKEFPVVSTPFLGKEMIYSGGGYFRLFPYYLIKSFTINSDYVMTYFHIKDFDKEQIKIYRSLESESALSRYIKNYYGLHNCFNKFNRFIDDFNFLSVEQADVLIDWEKQPKIKL